MHLIVITSIAIVIAFILGFVFGTEYAYKIVRKSKIALEEFNDIRETGRHLKLIFTRDGFVYKPGCEEYIIRSVEEAKGDKSWLQKQSN